MGISHGEVAVLSQMSMKQKSGSSENVTAPPVLCFRYQLNLEIH